MFRNDFPVAGLRGAAYNPRAIAPEALDMLRESISKLGMAKPIIVTPDGLIIAGHQRTKALKALGLDHTPAYVLDGITTTDEIKFNQLHNGTDLDLIDKPVRVKPQPGVRGYTFVDPDDIEGDKHSAGATIRAEISGLILKYGNWGCAVVTEDGECVSSPQYALACQDLNIPARIYVLPTEAKETAYDFFGRVYGEFSYDHLKRNTYIQTFAQPRRFRHGKEVKSETFDELVIPTMKPGERLLDFGSGMGESPRRVRRAGFEAFDVEFFRRSGESINTRAVHRMIDALCNELRRNGLFEVVTCDFVLNSVDTKQAESDVLHSINALCRPGGKLFFSGRSREGVEGKLRAKRNTNTDMKQVEFLDKDGFSAEFYKGEWFYQMFHSGDQVKDLIRRFLTTDDQHIHRHNGHQWRVGGVKQVNVPQEAAIEALRREFDLPWPDGQRVGRADDIEEAYRAALEITRKKDEELLGHATQAVA